MERLHYLLERVWERPDEELSIHFLKVRHIAIKGPLACISCFASKFESCPSKRGC